MKRETGSSARPIKIGDGQEYLFYQHRKLLTQFPGFASHD